MMPEATAHTSTQYCRRANHENTCIDSPVPASPEPTPAICRSSACSSFMTSMASSTVTMPRMCRRSSHTGMAARLYLVISSATSSWSTSGATHTRSRYARSFRRASRSATISVRSDSTPVSAPSASVV